MAQKIIDELIKSLQITQNARIEVHLDPDATPQQKDAVDKAMAKIDEAMRDAIKDQLQDGNTQVDRLTAKIKENTQKIKGELAALKRTVQLVKLCAEATKLAIKVMGIVV